MDSKNKNTMSEPKRYTGKTEGTVLGSPHWEHPEGEWAKWEEYARLKAEVERLQDFNDGLMAMRWQDEKGNLLTAADYNRLRAEVERLTADLNKMTKTPEGVDYVEVDVGFWNKSGSRLPSSYRTFWSNDKGVQP